MPDQIWWFLLPNFAPIGVRTPHRLTPGRVIRLGTSLWPGRERSSRSLLRKLSSEDPSWAKLGRRPSRLEGLLTQRLQKLGQLRLRARDRDRGTPRGPAPPTPRGIRVTYQGGSTGYPWA